MRVVALDAESDATIRMRLSGNVKGFEICDRATRGQMAKVRTQPELGRELADHFPLHLSGRRAAIERMVVRVHEHCGDVPGHGGRVRWFEHLTGVVGVEVRVVVAKPVR
jgi:hypothetical protein